MDCKIYKSKHGVGRVIKAFNYSMAGIKAAFMHEAAFREECLLAVFLIPLGLYLGDGTVEKLLLVGTTVLVLVVELLNSAVEAAVDHTSTEIHALAKRAKDIGSGAVFMSMMLFLLTWGMIFFD